MFARANRLDRAAFAHVYKYGKKAHTRAFLFVFLNASTLKAAAVVGKKVAKSAVARNRLKRRLYAVLSTSRIRGGHIVAIAKPLARGYSYAQLRLEVTAALARLGVGVDSR